MTFNDLTRQQVIDLIKCGCGSSTRDEGEIVYTFTDHGIGIAADLLMNPNSDAVKYAKEKNDLR